MNNTETLLDFLRIIEIGPKALKPLESYIFGSDFELTRSSK
jgi:hypothetical protein